MSNPLDEIIGINDLVIPLPKLEKLPIIDDPPSLTPWRPSAATRERLRKLDYESAMTSAFGESPASMMKAAAAAPAGLDNRTYEDSSQPTQPTRFPALPRATDPRKKQCFCSCPNCVRQDCRNCIADEKCEFSGLSVIADLVSVDDEMLQAARDRQQKRIAGKKIKKITKHRNGKDWEGPGGWRTATNNSDAWWEKHSCAICG
jgi:hypothetical protein